MDQNLIVTLIIINIALSGLVLVAVFVVLGMISQGKEE